MKGKRVLVKEKGILKKETKKLLESDVKIKLRRWNIFLASEYEKEEIKSQQSHFIESLVIRIQTIRSPYAPYAHILMKVYLYFYTSCS